MEHIKGLDGKVIGYIDESAASIHYYHLSEGLIGVYDKNRKKYTRYTMKLTPYMPLGNGDYGQSDILSIEAMRKKY